MINEFGIGFTGEKERSPADNQFGRTVQNYFDPVKRSTNGFTLGQLYPAANVYDILPQAFFNFVPDAPASRPRRGSRITRDTSDSTS
jgi:hypothetical protein